MLTPYDKFLVALIMTAIHLANVFLGLDIGLDETAVMAIVAALTPLLVYFVPNRERA